MGCGRRCGSVFSPRLRLTGRYFEMSVTDRELHRKKIKELRRKKIKHADPNSVRDALQRASKLDWPYRRWYACDSPNDMVDEFRKGRKPSDKHVVTYVAVSALHHCYDGWANLSQAVVAEASANPTVARHLSYYAELRAAMSILAAHGIGVMDNHHPIVDKEGTYDTIKGSTNEIAWDALELWADHTNYALIADMIRPDDIPLSTWISEFVPRGGGSLTDMWMKTWSTNFHKMPDDRHSRNRAAYHPAALTSGDPRPADDVARTLIDLWHLVEPEDQAGFPRIDEYLLRQAVGRLDSTMTRPVTIDKMTKALPLSEPRRRYWHELLASDQAGNEFLAAAASDHYESKQLLARALLLLYLATDSVSRLLSESMDEARTKLAFWWHDLRVRRHLWPGDEPPDAFSDLWDDVDVALARIDDWTRHNAKGCYYDLWRAHAEDVAVLGTTERIFLWGSGL